MVKIGKKMLYRIAVSALLCACGCGEDMEISIKKKKVEDNPSVSLTMRAGVLSDLVLQVNNLSTSQGQECYVYARNEETSARSGSFFLPANESREIGALEMKWKFKQGDKGFVCVRGQNKRLYFEILGKNEFRKWFGYDDIKEENVAAIVAERKRLETEAFNESLMREYVGKGGILFQSIFEADKRSVERGNGFLWPSCASSSSEKVKGFMQKIVKRVSRKSNPNVALRKYLNATDYFNDLFDVRRLGGDTHAPLVTNGIEIVCRRGYKREAGESLKKSDVQWSVIADFDEAIPDWMPIIVSANLQCESLAWEKNAVAIPLSGVGDLGTIGAVVVYKNGTVKIFKGENISLTQIYGGRSRQEVLKELHGLEIRYLTPTDIANVIVHENKMSVYIMNVGSQLQ